MNKQTRAVFFVLIILIGVLAASTSFFAAKTYKLGGKKAENSSSPAAVAGSLKSSVSSPTASAPPQSVTRVASSAEKPSKPADTYVVQKGETLFVVATSQGTSWQDLAEANGISDVDKIQAGQILIIPKDGQVTFAIDASRADSLQKDTDSGRYQFRLSPEDTARSDAPSVYGLKVDDKFVLKNKDQESGKAEVQVTHEDKNYIIYLIQPVTRGEKGIWAIESIKSV